MTITLDKFMDRLKVLPETEQEQWLARFEKQLSEAGSAYQLNDDERELIREGLADLDAGRVRSAGLAGRTGPVGNLRAGEL